MWLCHGADSITPLTLTFAVRTNPFTLECSVVAKSRSFREEWAGHGHPSTWGPVLGGEGT